MILVRPREKGGILEVSIIPSEACRARGNPKKRIGGKTSGEVKRGARDLSRSTKRPKTHREGRVRKGGLRTSKTR